MEKLLYNSLIFVHVLCGVLVLITGLVAMAVRKKGGKVHNLAGIVFYWSMFVIFISTLGFFVLDPSNLRYQFFVGIGTVSFYPNFSGKRILSMKKAINPTRIDWSAAWLVGICGVIMSAYAIYGFLNPKDFSGYQYLFGLFAILCFANAYGDLMVYSGKRKVEKMHWFLGHAGKMTGAYAAAVTAFCVNIVPRYLPKDMSLILGLSIWIVPGVLVGFIGNRIINHYKMKFGLSV